MIYIFKGVTHSDTSSEYLTSLGMDEEQIESIKRQEEFEASRFIEKEKNWVVDALLNADILINICLDDDERCRLSIDVLRKHRKALRDYVKDGVIVGERPVL